MRNVIAAAAAVGLAAGSARGVTLPELLAKYVEARGGAERLRSLESLRLTGKVSYGDADSRVEMDLVSATRRPGVVRVERSLQGLTAVRAFDGQTAWRISPFDGRREPERLSADDAKSLARAADLDGPLVNPSAKGISLEYLGTEDVDGTDAHKIRVTRPGGDIE